MSFGFNTAGTGNWVTYPGATWSWSTSTTTIPVRYQLEWDSWPVIYNSYVAPARPASERRAPDPAPERRASRTEAIAKADRTLMSLLTSAEQERLRDEGEFHVVGSDGNLYAVRRGYQQNVYQLERGEPVLRLCAHPNMYDEVGRLPDADAMIAQLLALQTDAPAFHRVANRTVIDSAISRRLNRQRLARAAA
jgi:hypothetical protein